MKTKFKLSKRLLSILLAVVMVFGMIPVSAITAFAAEATVITEVNIHFPEGMTEIPVPKSGETARGEFSFVADEDSVGIKTSSETLCCWVQEASRILRDSDVYIHGKCYFDYLYLYAENGYVFPEKLSDLTFTDPAVAEALDDFKIQYNRGNYLVLYRTTQLGDFYIYPTNDGDELIRDTDYTYEPGNLTITTTKPVRVIMANEDSETDETITIDNTNVNGPSTVAIDEVHINTEQDAAITVKGGNPVVLDVWDDSLLSAAADGDGINVASDTPLNLISSGLDRLDIYDVKFGVFLDGSKDGGDITVGGELRLNITDCSAHALYCRDTGFVHIGGETVVNISAEEYAIYAHDVRITGGKVTVNSNSGYAVTAAEGTNIYISDAEVNLVNARGGLRANGGKITLTNSAKLNVYKDEGGVKTAVLDKYPVISSGSAGEIVIEKNAVANLYSANDAISGGKTSILDNAKVNIVIDTQSTSSEYAMNFDDTLTIAGNATVDIDVLNGTKVRGLNDYDGTVNVSDNAKLTIDGTTYTGIYVDAINLSEQASVTVNAKDKYALYGEVSVKDTAVLKATSVDDRVLYDPCTVTPAENKVYLVKYGTSEDTATASYYTSTATIDDKSSWRYFSIEAIDFIPVTEATITIEKPVKNGTPDLSAEISENADFTVSAVTWENNPTKFIGNTEYTAKFTLSAKDGFAFLSNTTVTVGDAVVTTNLNADGTLSVSAKFSATDMAVPESIAVKIEPSVVAYTYGEKFNPSGLVITVTYDDGTTQDAVYSEENKEDFAFSAFDLTVATTKITVTYAGKTADITVEVKKANPEYTLPSELVAIYGDKLESIELPEANNGVWSWMNADTLVGNVDVNSFKLKFTPNDTDNYNVLENIDVAVTVSPKAVTITAEGKNAVVNTELPAYTYKVEGLVEGDELIGEPALNCEADISAVGEYDIVVSDADAGDNYSITYVNAKLTVVADGAVDAASKYDDELKDLDKDTVTSDDKAQLDKMLDEVNELLKDESITDNGKKALEEVKADIDDLLKAIEDKKVSSEAEQDKPDDVVSPQTSDNSNNWLWFALLFVNGTGVFGIILYDRKGKATSK